MSATASTALDSRVILITGASRGIGAAVARAAAADGATVLLCARDVPALERLADDIERAGGRPPVLIPLNLENANTDDYAMIAELVDQRCGRLDGIVCNAAALGELAPLASYDAVTWARVFQVNVHSVMLLLQACLPLARRSIGSSVVFTLAPEGLTPKPHWGAYAASKAALRAMLDLLAAEHAPPSPVRFNAVVPAPTHTRLRATAYPAENPHTLVEPAAVAKVFVDLLDARSRACRGQIFPAPGDGADRGRQ